VQWFLSVDPLTKSYPYYSPYQFAGNKPIQFIDLDGLEFQLPTIEKFKYGDNVVINAAAVVDNVVIEGLNGGISIINSGFYAAHQLYTNPSDIPEEVKSELDATYVQVQQYLIDQYKYATGTPIGDQWDDTIEGFKDPESYEAPLSFAINLYLFKKAPSNFNAQRRIMNSEAKVANEAASLEAKAAKSSNTLIHYTSEAGYNAIRESGELLPSIGVKNARYGVGQYLTDIKPGSLTMGQTSRRLFGVPWNKTYLTHYLEIDVTGLNVVKNAPYNYLIPNSGSLNLGGRVVGGGLTGF